jgi:hypothetical protein
LPDSREPWKEIEVDWIGHHYLSRDRLWGDSEKSNWKGSKLGLKDFPREGGEEEEVRMDLIKAANEYRIEFGKRENQQTGGGGGGGRLDGIKFSEVTGKPLPIEEELVREMMKVLWITPEDGLNSSRRMELPNVQVVKPMSETKEEIEEEKLRRDWVKRAFQHGWESEF